MFDSRIMLRQARRQKLFVSFGVVFSRRTAQLALNSLIMLSLLAVCIAPTGIKAQAKSLEEYKVKVSSLKDNRNRPVKKSLDNKSGKLSKLLLANPQFYVGYEELPEVNITKPFGIDTWIYANTFGTTTDLAVGVVFKAEVSCVGSGTCNSTRMKCDVAGCDGAISMFDDCGENIFDFGMDYCASKSLGDYDPDDICALVYPDAHVLYDGNYYFPHVAGTYLAGGFKLGWSKNVESHLRIYDIHFIYYGIPKSVLDRSILSSCQSKNGQGDPRECPLASTRDTQGSAGDPINTRTGDFDYSLVDLSLPTVSGPLLFQRTYSSLATELYTTTLGSGWTHNHDTRLIFPSDPGGEADVVWFKAHTANQYRFDITAPDTFTPYPGVLASLEGDAVNGYTLVDAAHNTYAFDGLGRLLSWNDAQGHAFTYTYTNNLLSRVSDPTGQRYLDFQYDTSDRLTTVSDNSGRYVSFDYANGNLASFTDTLDQTWYYTYNDPNYSHHLSEVIDPRGETAVRTEYDASGRAVRQYDGLDQLTVDLTYNPDGSSLIQDGRGYTTTHTYDARNTLVGQVNPLGGSIDKSYTYGFRPATLTDPNGHSTELSWSMDGANLLQAVDADDNLLQMSYDSLNNLTSLIDRRGNETTFTYAGKLLTSRTDALEHNTYYTYTTASDWPQPEGLLKAVTDPLGNTTSFSYDALGQMTVMTDTLGHATRHGYDSLGRLELTTDALGRATRYEYDAAGRLLKTTGNYNESYPQNYQDVFNIVTQYAYDPLSNLVAITDTLGHATHYDYDANNRLTAVTDALSHTTGYAYDPNGNLTSKTDANGVVTSYEYDALNRLAAVIENYRPGYTPDMETNVRTEYSYDPAGNLLAIRDARAVLEGRQEVTSFAYNELNRLVSETDALNHAWSYAYDPEGNLITMTDALNAATGYTYDPLGRLTAIDYPDPDADVSFEYNPLGWRTAMTDDGLGITTWDYDDLGRIESITDPFSNVVSYSYDAVGNRTGMTYPDLKSVGYQYDALNRLVQVTDWSQGITQYDYDPLSRLEQEVLPNGVASYYGYDAVSQVDSLSHETPSGRLASYQYTYDSLGNRTAATETLTQPLPDLIFSDAFESGNFLGWSGTKTTSQLDLAVTSGAAMYGSYGEKASPVGGRVAFTYDNSPQAEKRYRARFYFDPNNVGLGSFSGNYHTIFKAYNADYTGGSLGTAVVLLEFRKYNTSYQVRAGAYHNGGYTYTGWQTINNAPNAIELEWKAAATPGGSNGYLSWWLNGSAKTGLVNLKNGTLAVESAFLGAVDGVDSGASGWYCFDAFVSRRESYTGTEMIAPRPCGSSLDGGEEPLLPEDATATTESSSAIVSLTATFEAGEALVGETLIGEILITDTFLLTDTFRISETLDGDPRISDTVVLTDTFWISDGTTLTETGYLAEAYDLLMEQWLTATLEVADPGVGEGLALLAGDSTTRIDYTYDPLGRLTAADYTPQTFFHYTYDAAGNRTSLNACLGPGCIAVITTYAYDYAQRLSSVNGVAYTWDNNGNLLSNGVTTYTYNHANRLASITNPQYSIQNVYNGLGDRLRQTVNGNQTNYALDLNNDLAQVLSDGSNTYLYGLNRIAQQNIVGRQYYLGDALGSVRQLVNPVGTVTLTRSYEPFGKLLSSAGNPLAKYSFTGEWQDPTGLIFLRARYYDPATGRFLSKDPVRGLIALPGTLNPYTYTINNPIQYVDPSGKIVWIPAILGIGALVGGTANVIPYLLDTDASCWDMGIIGKKFSIGALAGIAGTGATMLFAWLLPASLPGYIIGAISGGVGGGISTIGYNLLAGQPWGRNLAGGILLGTVSGGIAGSLTPVRPGPTPKMSWNRGWPLAGSYVGKKSIDVVLEEVTQDVIGAFLAITSSSYADAPIHNNNLPVYQYWEPR